ncbi:hypothetical protein GCM10011594_10630 [Nakamurella endophytica]|uniref:Cytochrome c oxidase assembly protein n=1 Tax=Nakamurella endophytica TaxID=1748367 RepID=A0A917SRN4_9ACTN|nr:cytochrome c oxidase assembly protein [Nakamurella endophytica]GGL92715.1 hypothetical protein GCM10011594_10630 [Nakamurella endophytica]
MTGQLAGAWWVTAVAAVAAGYAAAVRRLGLRGVVWPRGRQWAAAGAAVLAGAAFLVPHGDVRGVVVAHLVLSGLVPLCVALAAPVTLVLRSCGPAGRRRLLGVLHGRVIRLLSCGPVVLVLQVGGTAAYFLTPLYGWTQRLPAPGVLVHLHMLWPGACSPGT